MASVWSDFVTYYFIYVIWLFVISVVFACLNVILLTSQSCCSCLSATESGSISRVPSGVDPNEVNNDDDDKDDDSNDNVEDDNVGESYKLI